MTNQNSAANFMSLAMQQAHKAAAENEVPVGAVVIHNNKVIAAAHNLVETQKNSAAHAEMLAIAQACNIVQSKYLPDCDIYVTLEPCPMCAQALALARIRRLYFAAYDPKSGGVENGARIYNASSCHHQPEIYGGIGEQESKQLLQQFFKQKRV